MNDKLMLTIRTVYVREGASYNHIDCTITIGDWEYEFTADVTEKCKITRQEFVKGGNRVGFDYAALYTANGTERLMSRWNRTKKFYDRVCDLLDSFLTTTEFEIK